MNPKLFIVAFFALTIVSGLSQTIGDGHWTREMTRSNDEVFLDVRKLNDPDNLAAAEAAFKEGHVSQRAMTMLRERATNAMPQEIYGRITDQDGQPVAGVTVNAAAMFQPNLGDNPPSQYQSMQTDAAGRFQFTGMKARNLMVTTIKVGYVPEPNGLPYMVAHEKKTSPDDRANFILWKMRGQMQVFGNLYQYRLNNLLRCDGTPTQKHMVESSFNNIIQVTNDNGTVKFSLVRSPLQLPKGETNWDWTIKIEFPGGGLLAENDPYPYWAPDSGYQPVYQVSMKASDAGWHGYVTQNFYVKIPQGGYGRMQAGGYGRMSVRIHTGTTPAKLDGEVRVQEDGTQNLQPSEY
jgi:Carboxypeptidase regulatory-like domain